MGDPTPADEKPQAEIRGGDRPADYIPKKGKVLGEAFKPSKGKPDFEVGLDDEDEDETDD